MLSHPLNAEVTGMYTRLVLTFSLDSWCLAEGSGIASFSFGMNRLFVSAAPHPRTVHTGDSKLGGQVTFQGIPLFSLFSVALESLFVQEESSVTRHVIWPMW